ncbi:hypothetical protein RJ640_020312 [Escallonia rubra]|uniref:Serpin domain-containing protein n=1 Tax=Escallonia rubra TaxID=112253 RepID=A0AA88RUF4_9ASTE|nr:hypothetical protein RJ640_020312 [Escallonia rubra]
MPKINIDMKLAGHILLKEASKSEKNVVCSPLSLDAMLNMVAAGSKGDTSKQLLHFLGSSNLEDVNSKSSGMMRIAEKSLGSPDITFVNGVWVDQRFPIKPSYMEVLNGIYKAKTINVDFLNKVRDHPRADQATHEINSWAENATKGLIRTMIPPGALNRETMIVLANALYFKGAWACKFDSSMTQDKDFHLLNGKRVSVPFMTSDLRKTRYAYGMFDGFQVLKIPYQAGQSLMKYSMYFILPNEKEGLQNLIEKFNADPGLFDQQFHLRTKKLAELRIPKFKFSHEFSASKFMTELGLTLPFEPVKELTGIVDSPHGDVLFISAILHKACIEIDEEGTEAAAVTRSVMCGCARGYVPPPPPTFVADHPFMFLIKEETSGAMLFAGALLNPAP